MVVAVVICVALAAVCDAIMDTLAHHYSVSRFQHLNPYFWNPEVSWLNKYVDRDPAQGQIKWSILWIKFDKHVAFTDAWHFFKSFKIVLWCIAIGILTQWWWIIVLGILRNYVFSFNYEFLLLSGDRRLKIIKNFFPNMWDKFKSFTKKVWWNGIIAYFCITKKK